MKENTKTPSHFDAAFSLLGERFKAGSGIETLMDDLGRALSENAEEMLMLGGGNPAHIPQIEAVWKERMKSLVASPAALRQVLGIYDPPRGNAQFIRALADMLAKECGWPVGPENIAVTSGGQTAFFCLFNLLAGKSGRGRERKILLPIVPEYIGYSNQGLGASTFRAHRPHIVETAPHRFKYKVDFDRLKVDEHVAAICVSRPTNPTGNVLEDAEMARLSHMAKERGIPFIIDNAYGHPFPSIVFTEARPLWDEHHVLVMSLSKLGLPGTRTAVVVGPPSIAKAVASMTAVTGLANGNFGQAIMRPLLENGELLRLSREVIQPYYRRKLDDALKVADAAFPKRSGYSLHESGGALFLWLWLKNSPLNSQQFYERLKVRNVLVVPGHHFFFGLSPRDASWTHSRECVRISFAMEDSVVERGLGIIGEEIAKIYEMR